MRTTQVPSLFPILTLLTMLFLPYPAKAQCPLLSAPVTEIDVNACGAVPNDGVADQVAIQAAIDAAAIFGARVLFPAGVYTLSAGLQIQDSMELLGQGSSISILERIQNFDDAITVTGASDVRIRGLGFRDQTRQVGRFFFAADVEGLTLEACRFSNIGAVALRINQAVDVRVEGCTFEEIFSSAIFFGDPGPGEVTERVWIVDNRFYRTNTAASQGHAAVNQSFVSDSLGPIPEERYRAFQIVRNHIEETGASGIRVKGYRSVVAFNILDQGSIGVHDEGITFFGSQNAIYGIVVTGFKAHGILFWANDHQGTGQPLRDNLVASNLIWDNGSAGVAAILSEEQARIENLKISGNLLAESVAGRDQKWGVRVGDFNDPSAPPLINVSVDKVSVQGNSSFGHVNGPFDVAERRGGVYLGSNDDDLGATKLAVTASALSGASSFPAGLSVVSWQIPTEDDDSFYDPSFPNRLTVREGGVYAVSCSLDWSPRSGGHRTASIRQSGGTVVARSRVAHAGGATPVPVAAHTTRRFEAGDWVECLAQHNSSGGNLAVQAGNLTYFRLVKVEG